MALLGFIKKPDTWGELRRDIDETSGDGRWRGELFYVIRRSATDRTFYPIQALFRTYRRVLYRPVVHGIRRVGKNGPIDGYTVLNPSM